MIKRNKEKTKSKILAAALKEFASNGFSGARVDTIAARAKTNKALIYHYFKDKDALFNAILEKVYGDLQTYNICLIKEGLTPEEGIIALIVHTYYYFAQNPSFISICDF